MLAFIDAETTNLIINSQLPLPQQPHITEFAILLTDDRGELLDQWSSLINPGVPLSAEITKITGLTDALLASAPAFPDVLPQIARMMKRADTLIAHNLDFDLSMLVFELRRIEFERRFPFCHNWIDTVPLSGGMKLKDWAVKCGVPDFKGQEHRALSDAKLLLSCWKTTLPKE
jgi:DNA polymerase-3 subunit epsilon